MSEGLKVLGGVTVAKHPELLVLCRSPALDWHFRQLVKQAAEQEDRAFMGDAGDDNSGDRTEGDA